MSGYLHWLLAATIHVALAKIKCRNNQFACDNGQKCVHKNKFCDGWSNCGDKSDEIRRNNSEVQTGIPCRQYNGFVCMLPERYHSRKDDFCAKNPECDENEFACSDGSACLDWYHFCDNGFFVNCIDKSNQILRNNSEVQTGIPCRHSKYVCMLPERYRSRKDDLCTKNPECDDNEFACSDGSACLEMDRFCEDNSRNCVDKSDHIRRNNNEVQTGIPCRRYDTVCMLPERYRSRKDDLCTKNPECYENEFTCSDGSACVEMLWFCGGYEDCQDGSDEIKRNYSLPKQDGVPCRGCWDICMLPYNQVSKKALLCFGNSECEDNEFMCTDGSECIPLFMFCDGKKHCSDGSDEVLFKIDFPVSGTKCPIENLICVLPLSQGDKHAKLCSKGVKCGANEFACLDGSVCLPKEQFCDGTAHCSDESDEIKEGSDNPAALGGLRCRQDRYKCILPDSQKTKKTYICEKKFECADNEFGCLDNTQCLPSWLFCDGYADCEDGSDEIKRNYSLPKQDGVPCRASSDICMLPYNQISKKALLCNGNSECEDNEFMCTDGSKCIPLIMFCNGYKDCSDGSDETKANSSDSGIQCRLHDQVCILPDQLLRRKEKFCKKDVNCDDNQFRCADGNQCLSALDFCDGREDCDDGSDEMKEGSDNPAAVGGSRCRRDTYKCILPDSQKTKKTYICKKKFECADDEFECLDNTQCIPFWWFCDGYDDGVIDCNDGSDEMSVGSAADGLACRRDIHVCLLPQSQMSKKVDLCRRPA